MEIRVTRDSVAAGDDSDAPHERTFSFPDSLSIEEAIEHIAASKYLARIRGGRATWSVVSGFPIAVIAEQWPKPEYVSGRPIDRDRLQVRDGIIGLHFNYHVQMEPELVLAVLKRLRLDAF